MSNYNSVEKVSTTVFQPIESVDDESKLMKSSKKGKNDYSPPASIPTPIEYNYEEVVLFVKQGN